MSSSLVQRANVNLDNEPRAAAGFAKNQQAYAALAETELVQPTVDITDATATALATATRLAPLRDEAVLLPGTEASCIDNLESLALGLMHAQSYYDAAIRPDDMLLALNQEASQTRDRLRAEVESLMVNGVLDQASLTNYNGATGYKNVIDDVRMLVAIYRTHWTGLQGKTCRTEQELDRADAVASRMTRLVGERERGAVALAEWANWRTRAYTLLVRNYDQVRRAVQYLRYNEGDADTIAPSLFAMRGRRKSSHDEPAAPNTPQPGPGVGPNGPFVPPPALNPPPATPAPVPTQPKAGNPSMPGGSPFLP